MADFRPFTWKPADVVVFKNVSDQNLLLDLASGLQRLDAGRTIRITASALEQSGVKYLVEHGLIQVESAGRK